MADHAAAAAGQLHEHLATASAECAVCPVCRTLHAVRRLSPEVKDHLAAAASSLAQAATALMATHPEDPPEAAPVEHIDLDDWPDGS
jgi:hypothetical protein